MNRLVSGRHSLLLSSLLLLAACSGGGGGGSKSASPPTSGSSALLLTPASDPELLSATARVEGVEWIRADGSSTGNLLATPVDVPVVSESEDVVAVPVRDPDGDGRFVQCRVSFAPVSMHAVHRNGNDVDVQIDAARRVQTTPIDVEHRRGEATWIELHHRSGTACFDDRGTWRWAADLEAQRSDGVRFRHSHVRVGDVDARHFTFIGVFDAGCGAVRASFIVRETTDIRLAGHGRDHDNDEITRRDLFLRLVPGARVNVRGTVNASGSIDCERLILHEPRRNHDEDEVEFLAVLTRLDVASELAEVDVLAARRGTALVERFFAGRAHRRIALTLADVPIRRSGDHGRGGGIALLGVGDRIEVEVEPFPQAEPMRPREVEVQRRGADVEGLIVDTRRMPDSFVINPSTHDSLFRNGNVSNAVTVRIVVTTSVFLERESRPVPVGDIRAGTRVRVTGQLIGTDAVDATLVRLRAEHGRGSGRGGD